MIETYCIITFICVVCIFLTRSKVGTAICCVIIAFVLIGGMMECHQDQVKEEEHEGKVQMYYNGKFEWVTPEEQHQRYKQDSEGHYRKWAAEHPEEAEKDRIRDSISRAHYGYGTRSIYDPK